VLDVWIAPLKEARSMAKKKKKNSIASQEQKIRKLIDELIDGEEITDSAVVSTVGLPIVNRLSEDMPEITISAMASSVLAIATEGHGSPDLGEMKAAILSFNNGNIILKKIYGPNYLGILIVYTPLHTTSQINSVLDRIEISAAKLATILLNSL
jgi:predicted regulator of Ras-like GTPase activity (Roadblock/LC7/MglB family)